MWRWSCLALSCIACSVWACFLLPPSCPVWQKRVWSRLACGVTSSSCVVSLLENALCFPPAALSGDALQPQPMTLWKVLKGPLEESHKSGIVKQKGWFWQQTRNVLPRLCYIHIHEHSTQFISGITHVKWVYSLTWERKIHTCLPSEVFFFFNKLTKGLIFQQAPLEKRWNKNQKMRLEQITVRFDLNEDEVLLFLKRRPHLCMFLFVSFSSSNFELLKFNQNWISTQEWFRYFLMLSNQTLFFVIKELEQGHTSEVNGPLIASLISFVEIWKIQTCDFYIVIER